jgi:hypothetical protein
VLADIGRSVFERLAHEICLSITIVVLFDVPFLCRTLLLEAYSA